MVSLLLLPLLGTACDLFLDLPDGWEDAERVDDFTQHDCEGSPYDTGWSEQMTAWSADPGIRVEGDPLHFRCEQDVEAFYKVEGGQVDVLIQPIDMNPRVVAGCDCLYRVEAGIPESPPADVTLYRRWDAINDPNDPVLVGSAEVAE